MSDKSNNLGRAFEYACIEVLEKRIAEHRTVKVDKTSVMAAYNAWQEVEQEQQDSFFKLNLSYWSMIVKMTS